MAKPTPPLVRHVHGICNMDVHGFLTSHCTTIDWAYVQDYTELEDKWMDLLELATRNKNL